MKHELLAPAGGLEAGYAALHYGADAVYLGLSRFSARAGAENFTPEELDELTAYAHSLGRKVFVALNTILSEAEVRELPEIFRTLAQTKVDALIIQDLGVLHLAKKLLPEVELHASTQMAVHNVAGVKFLQRLGFKRVVLARELSLAEIKEIAAAAPDVDLEVFVHGALCYSYSGQCLFSALEYGKSANRGRCAYPCRGEFSVAEKEGAGCLKSHLFSMKDLALEEEVLQIPALSLKIEGRKKSPLYVAAVTNYYRHILDGRKKDLHEAEDIKQIFSRPWCRFHFNEKDKDVVDRQFVGHRGLPVGKVEKAGKNRITVKIAHAVARYDGVQIDVPGSEKPFGFGIKNLYLKGKPALEASAGQTVELGLPEEHPYLPVGAPVYLASSSAVKGRYAYSRPKPGAYRNLQPLAVTLEIGAAEVWAMAAGAAVSAKGEFPVAKDTEKTRSAAENAFAKTGGTGFAVAALALKNPENRFVPVSVLNDLRRRLLAEVAAIAEQGEKSGEYALPEIKPCAKSETAPEKLRLFRLELDSRAENWQKEDMAKTWFVLPQICRNLKKLAAVVKEVYEYGARRFVAENYYAFELLRKYRDVQIGAGSFIYVMNRYAAAELKKAGAAWAMPALESSPANMAELVASSPLPLVQAVYVYPPLFTSAVCIRPNACKDCRRGTKIYTLKKDGRAYKAVSRNCQMQVFAATPYEREVVPGVCAVVDERQG